MSTNDQYALNWSNHTNHIRKAFDTLLAGNEFVDVTLSCEGKKISAHKMLLSACSAYFHDLFRENPCQHPIVILKDVKFQNLMDILKFMYNGEVSVATENFDSFLKTAELLQVSGLTDDENKYDKNEKEEEEEAPESSQAALTEQPSEQTSLIPVTKKVSIEKPKEMAVSKKRTTETSPEEGTSQKKKKENELNPDIEIKQEELDVLHLEEHIQIKDPLELDQHNESAEIKEVIQPVTSQKFPDVQDLLNVKASMQHQLAEISAKQDGLEQLLKNHHCEASSKLDEVNIFPLSTIEDVVNLENYLNDVANNTKIIAHLKRVTGSGQQWKSVCYKLSAILFTKDILTKYSWTGVSRTGTGKNPFNKLVNILDVFYKVVFFSDNTFTHMNKEFFLKDCILKHSRSRLHPKKTVSKAKTTVEAEHDGEVQAEAN